MSRVSRRTALKGAFLIAATSAMGSLLAACSAAQPTAAPSGGQQPAAGQTQGTPAASAPGKAAAGPISFLCRNDIVVAYGAENAIQRWNESHESQITLEKPAQGIDVATKAQAAIAADDMVWDGFSVIVAPWDIATWVRRQVIVPLDDLIKASTEPDAAELLPGLIGTIHDSVKMDGKTYMIPGNVGSAALQWFWDPLREVGVEKQPETWEETQEVARQIKAKSAEMTPFASISTPEFDLFSLMYGAIKPDELFTEQQVFNLQHDEAVNALEWMRAMANEGLMPRIATDVNANWDKGTVAMLLAYDVKGQHAQKTYGYDKADTGVNLVKNKGDIGSGTLFWMNGSVVFNKAKNPQGMADFFLWWFGPSNEEAQKTLVATAAKPCYTYTYEKFVQDDPNFKWEQVGIDFVAKSVPYPTNTYWGIEGSTVRPWIEKFMAEGSTLTAAETLENAAKDRAEEIGKQKI